MKNLFLLLFASITFQSGAQIITTIAGNGSSGFSGDGMPATATSLTSPYGVGIDSIGNLFVGDAGNNRIRRIDTFGMISTVAGTGVAGYNGDAIPATAAQLNFPYGMAVNRAGVIVIADMSNHRIRRIQGTGGVIITIGGTGVPGFSGDGGPAILANINNPQGIFWDAYFNVYFADHDNHRIRKIDAGGNISTIAGNGMPGYGGDGGPATAAKLYYPSGVTADTLGNIYIADMFNHRIRKVDTAGIITTVAGTGTLGYFGDGGPATLAYLRYPKDISVDKNGNLLISDTDNQRVRRVNAAGIISTIAGTGVAGYFGDGGPALLAKLNYAQGIFVDNEGSIYIGDCLNNRIRKMFCTTPVVDPITGPDTVCIGSTITLSSATTGGLWTASNGNATISVGGVVTGAAVGLDTIKYVVDNSCTSVEVSHLVYVKACVITQAGTNPFISTQVSIYPNPATSELTISAPDVISSISISNLLGREVYAHRHNTTQVRVDISILPKGIYMVKVNGAVNARFVKE